MSIDDFEAGEYGHALCDDWSARDEYGDDPDGYLAEYERLCAALDAYGSRRHDRDPRVRAARERLRCAVRQLYVFDDGHSSFGYEGPNVGEWDELQPVANRCLRDLRLLVALMVVAKTAHKRLRKLYRTFKSVTSAPNCLPRRLEIRAKPPSAVRRSEPDLALAPPLSCVALLSDDAVAALAV